MPRPPTALIPNGTLELFLEQQPSRPSALGVPDGDFLVTFAGTHGIAQALDRVLDAAELLRASAHFAFVGDGPMKASLVQPPRERGVAQRRVPPTGAAGGDAAAARRERRAARPALRSPDLPDFVPSKLIDSMASGRPVILSAAGEAARILGRSGGGRRQAGGSCGARTRLSAVLHAIRRRARGWGSEAGSSHDLRLRLTPGERLEQVLFEVAPPKRG